MKIVVAKKLTYKKRKSLPSTSFVFPKEKRYPIHDESHARNALARSSGTKDESKVRAAVKRKFPGIEVSPKKKKKASEIAALLVEASDILDSCGMVKEADIIDGILREVIAVDAPGLPTAPAGTPPPGQQTPGATTSDQPADPNPRSCPGTKDPATGFQRTCGQKIPANKTLCDPCQQKVNAEKGKVVQKSTAEAAPGNKGV